MRKYVIARKFEKKGKTVTKRPNIQRLITPIRIQRKRARAAAKKTSQAKSQRDASEYARCVVPSVLCAWRVVLPRQTVFVQAEISWCFFFNGCFC